jgi:hypothetical protein
MKSTFKNELGNRITILTETRYAKRGYPEMKIYIAGPESSSSWIITMREAQKMHKNMGCMINKPIVKTRKS